MQKDKEAEDDEVVEKIDLSDKKEKVDETSPPPPPIAVESQTPTIEITTPGAAKSKRLNTTFGRFADWYAGNGSYQLNAFALGILAAAKKANNRAHHTNPNDDTLANIILDALSECIPITINFTALCAGARRSAEIKIAEEENANNPQARGLLDFFETPTQITVPQSLFYNKPKNTPSITNPEKWNKTVKAVKSGLETRSWQAEISDAVASKYLQKVILVYNAGLLIAEQNTNDSNQKKLLNDIAFWGTLGFIIVGFVFAFFRSFARTGLFHAEDASNTLHKIFTEHTASKPERQTDDSESEKSEEEKSEIPLENPRGMMTSETSSTSRGLVAERGDISPMMGGGDPRLYSPKVSVREGTVKIELGNEVPVQKVEITFGRG